MIQAPFSKRVQNAMNIAAPVIQFITDARREEGRRDPQACDFLMGNPHELALPGYTAALQKWTPPQDKEWFAYKLSEPRAQEVVAAGLQKSHRMAFAPEDISLTTGAFAGLAAALALLVDPDDEVIFISPPWFFYEMLITAYDGQPVRVLCDRTTFDLDLEAIRLAISPKTRAIIINTPNNPTGRIYPPETLQRLAALLAQASRQNGRDIYLLSDEAYRNILYDGNAYHSPAAYYPNTFVIYTYGKTLLTPGMRIGYIALPPTMPNRELIRTGLLGALVMTGFNYPNALLQYALEDLEKLSIDVGHLQTKRDRMVSGLRRMGYEVNLPEATFYLLFRSPIQNDLAFTTLLEEHKIYCLPGTLFEMPGYFRISLTGSDEMIDRSLPGFAKVLEEVKSRV